MVERLAAFRPTRVAIEADWGDTTDPALYRAYRSGRHQLSRSESQQIGFRLAGRMDLPEIDGIDMTGDFPIGDVLSWRNRTRRSYGISSRAGGWVRPPWRRSGAGCHGGRSARRSIG